MHLSFVTISFLPRDMPEGNFKGLPWRGQLEGQTSGSACDLGPTVEIDLLFKVLPEWHLRFYKLSSIRNDGRIV